MLIGLFTRDILIAKSASLPEVAIYNRYQIPSTFVTSIVIHLPFPTVDMRFLQFLAAGALAPIISLAAPTGDHDGFLQQYKRENLCSLKSPPSLCQPNSSVTTAETAQRAYDFYRAFVVDGDPRKMFSLIDSSYLVSTKRPGKHETSSNINITAATPPGVQQRATNHLASFL